MKRALCLHCKYAIPYDLTDTYFHCTFFQDDFDILVVGRECQAFKDIETNEYKRYRNNR